MWTGEQDAKVRGGEEMYQIMVLIVLLLFLPSS